MGGNLKVWKIPKSFPPFSFRDWLQEIFSLVFRHGRSRAFFAYQLSKHAALVDILKIGCLQLLL